MRSARRASITACRHACSRAADVGADDVVGAIQLGRPARVVIGQRQAQRAHAESVEQAAEADVSVWTGIPLRKHENRTARLRAHGALRRASAAKVQRVHGVVLGIPRLHRARKRHRAGGAVDAWPECVIRCVGSLEEALCCRKRRERPSRGESRSGGASGWCPFVSIQSSPHSNGLTTRSLLTACRRRSQA